MPFSDRRSATLKTPHLVLDSIFAFPPNRDILGGTAYFIVENAANFLIDCPAWNEPNEQFLRERGGVSVLFITHRGGIGKAREIQEALGCKIVIQEQEAYLLPGLEVATFESELTLSSSCQGIWTPGHSPGSACLYSKAAGGVLFSGRHLLPNQQGEPIPLRMSKTFHWRRQLRSVQILMERFNFETFRYICPGANTGFLRGKGVIDQAYDRLVQLDLNAQLQAKPVL
ncbi:MBL fold metallo-hydrolase [Coleofasciculus sp. LEGE 07092]|uniref:MBL fold metallo-hydrolase n=1 Tax=Coleofasciculus sp. LEGE 07081 TaxID=2777967 RepID=UPI00187F2AAB|nr:MBL fold metallo-hydrolase [Coleofasciculus sp. LEGE 07081]MBE9149813.1 MBL fold metallo-hydrolase [Coleofasciculus sp. LEGE 07092]